jgi:hypothetical protein
MFWLLILAHIMGDYPLQPDWLVRAKLRLPGLTLHVLIHLAMMMVIAGEMRGHLWPLLLALAGAHFAIDLFKGYLSTRYPELLVETYVLDQGLHVLTIYLVSIWAGVRFNLSLASEGMPLALFASGFLFTTYVWFINEKIGYLRDGERLAEIHRHMWSRMTVRGLVFGLTVWLSSSAALAGFAGTAVLWPYHDSSWPQRDLFVDLLVGVMTGVAVMVLRDGVVA